MGIGIFKILIVDDEPNVLSSLRRLFMDEEYEIFTAASAAEGLRILEHEPIEIVISDYRMPDVTGVEFLRDVCRRWPDTVRIVLSGYADVSVIVAAINDGQVFKFIAKPWNNDDLKSSVVRAIERYYYHKNKKILEAEIKRKSMEFSEILNIIPMGVAMVNTEKGGTEFLFCNSKWPGMSTTENGQPALPASVSEFICRRPEAPEEIEIMGTPGRLYGSETENGKAYVLCFYPLEK